MSLSTRFLYTLCIALLLPMANAWAGKDPNTLKAGVSYIWLSEYDSQGVMFNNSFAHHFGKRVAVGLNLGLASGTRFDDIKQIYSIKNTFYMANLEASYDLFNTETLSFRVGGGAGARHRAEINSSAQNGTADGSVRHINTSDFGYNGFIENDFNFLRNGVAGGRIGYYYYATGTPIFSIGLHMGFKF